MSFRSDLPPIRYPVYDVAQVVLACSTVEASLPSTLLALFPQPRNGRMTIHQMQGRMLTAICTLCNCRVMDAATVFSIDRYRAHNRMRWWKTVPQEAQIEYIQLVRDQLEALPCVT